MRNFNNERSIMLNEYLPEVLKDVIEMRAIMNAETSVIKAMWTACEDCMNDQFISESTENGIARREKMLNITPYATDTLEDRRFRVQARYNENIPYTRKNLDALLKSLCGTDGYELSILTQTFTVNVKVAHAVKKQVNSIKDLLERVLPYNMIYTIDLLIDPMCFHNREKFVLDLYGQISGYQNTGNTLSASRLLISIKAKQSYSFKGEVLMDNMFCLDGSFRLNGTKKLNAAHIKEDL